jgi:hypothetical protein
MIDSPEIAKSSFVPEDLPTCTTTGTQCLIAAVHSASRYGADAKASIDRESLSTAQDAQRGKQVA